MWPIDSQFDSLVNFEVVPLGRIDRSGEKREDLVPEAQPAEPHVEAAEDEQVAA